MTCYPETKQLVVGNKYLPPATKLGQGYVFTRVCDSVHRGGVHGCGEVCSWQGGMRGCWGGMHSCWGVGGMCGCLGGHGCQGACVVVWLPGGHAWLPGGMRGCVVARGACMVARGHVVARAACVVARVACVVARAACVVAGGHAWLREACGCGGHVWLPGGLRGACVGYDEIRSMSGRYASYWNAFLFNVVFCLQASPGHCINSLEKLSGQVCITLDFTTIRTLIWGNALPDRFVSFMQFYGKVNQTIVWRSLSRSCRNHETFRMENHLRQLGDVDCFFWGGGY